MISLLKILTESVVLKPINANDSDFGESYYSKFVKGSHKFFSIMAGADKVGEVEYGDVDDNTFEIISIHLDKQFRGKGYGQMAFAELGKVLKKNTVILKAAPSSRKFWKKLGFEPMAGVSSYFTKTI